MSTPGTDILSSTLDFVREEAVDNLFRQSEFLDWCDRKGVIKERTGGAAIDHPTILTEHSTITNLGGSGYGAVSETVTDPLVLATFQWCNFSAPVILTKVEEMANRGDEARVSILEARMKTVLGQIRRAIETQVFAGSSAILSDLESFNGVDAAAGWFEELAFGSQGNSVGTIGKATYPTSWQNQVADVADDFATNGLIEINKGAIAAKTYAPEGQIDGVFLSLLAYGLLKNELQPQERYGMGDKTQDPGRLILQWNGSDVLTQQDLGFTGSGAANQVSGYGLNSKSLVLYFDKDGRMNLLPPVPVAAAIAYRRDMLVRMQMAASHLASMVMILNAEA